MKRIFWFAAGIVVAATTISAYASQRHTPPRICVQSVEGDPIRVASIEPEIHSQGPHVIHGICPHTITVYARPW
jgi:hypothetical protein